MQPARLALRPSRLGALALLAVSALACRVAVGTDPSAATTPPATARPEPAPAVAPKIDPARMFADLEYLSSDALNGRFTFSDDLAVAADHITKQYEAMGLGPVGESYRLAFTAPYGFEPEADVIVWVERRKGESLQVAGEVITTLSNGGGKSAYAEAVWVRALGSASAAVRGKIVVAPAPPPERLAEAILAFAALEPAGLVLVSDDDRAIASSARGALASVKIPVAWVSPAAAKEWMGIEVAKGKTKPPLPKGMKLSISAKHKPLEREAFNVVAVLPGTTAPEQLVILGAHYDHIGTSEKGVMCREKEGDTICNGADDNASGTAMVLEIARAFSAAHYRPARTIVFAHFAGEELGLHGSKALASQPPKLAPFEGGTVVAMVNLDMVGRLGENGLAIGGVSSSDAWMPLLDEVGTQELPIVYERAINARSDHANFYRNKVPVLFFFTGLHDDYHQAGDHFEAINRDGMVAIGQLVADLTRSLADGADVPYAPPRTEDEGVVSRMPGADESTVEKRTGSAAKAPTQTPAPTN